MSTTCELSFQQKSLFQQGYQHYSAQELKNSCRPERSKIYD